MNDDDLEEDLLEHQYDLGKAEVKELVEGVRYANLIMLKCAQDNADACQKLLEKVRRMHEQAFQEHKVWD